MGNSKQRKQERTAKELLVLGRDAKQVRANALTMEEQVRASSVTIGELRTQVSQLEIDRDAWKERAVVTQEAYEQRLTLAEEENKRILKLERELSQRLTELTAQADRVTELEAGLADLPKTRRRLQERAVEVADLQKKVHALEALLKRHERAAAGETAMLAAAKAGI